jgi:hypothetical protein
MEAKQSSDPQSVRADEEAAKESRAMRGRVEHNRLRGITANLEDAAAHAHATNAFAQGFTDNRRA